MVFGDHGPGARLADVAAQAGVSEATLYRHYASRRTLLTALFDFAVEEAFLALERADLDSATVPEGVARVCRAFVALQSKFAIFVRMAEEFRDEQVESRFADHMTALMRRGIDQGVLRADHTEFEHVYMLGGLIRSATELAIRGVASQERAAQLASTTFLEGASA